MVYKFLNLIINCSYCPQQLISTLLRAYDNTECFDKKWMLNDVNKINMVQNKLIRTAENNK